MKKRNLKNLALNRRTVSSLKANQSVGGNAVNSVVICAVSVGNITNCVRTADCYRTYGCVPLTQKECISIVIDCITQTEFPTCRNCA